MMKKEKELLVAIASQKGVKRVTQWMNRMEVLAEKHNYYNDYFKAKKLQIEMYTINQQIELAIHEANIMYDKAKKLNDSNHSIMLRVLYNSFSVASHLPMQSLSGRQWGQLGLHPMADPDSPVLGFAMMDVMGVDGVVVEDVVVDSPADEAGIRPGDVITYMDSRGLRSVRDMLRELGRHRPGETVPLVVLRKGTAYKADLTFGRRGDLMSGLKQMEQPQG